MTTSEVLNQLRNEGFTNAKRHILGHGIKAGAITRPALNSSLQFVWTVQNVEQNDIHPYTIYWKLGCIRQRTTK